MIVYAPAKINIGLKVLNKRKDLYHNLDSIFYPIPLYDILEIVKSDGFSLKMSGIKIDGDIEDNLIYKAWIIMRKHHNIGGIAVHLHKQIPTGAGLGGGSSDASSILKSINQLYSLNLDDSELERYAADLGADCPFFIKAKASRAQGIGTEFSNIELDLSDYYLVLIKPDIHISTNEAYANVYLEGANASINLGIIPKMGKWSSGFVNSFENHLFKIYPELKIIKNKLYKQGAIYASMSGSGAAIYGIFREKPDLPSEWNSYFVWKKKL
jgi:4-diphosphocytidyl-2-C-methyl-D-erythritol kinase